jgi:rhodanese-related sulfurtransferase
MKDEISVTELARWREERDDVVVLDVREPMEVQIVAFPGALEVPMREIPARVGELPKDKTLAVICHHGGRSHQVVGFLRAQGFTNAVNVDGGIDAYALTVDPSLPRY